MLPGWGEKRGKISLKVERKREKEILITITCEGNVGLLKLIKR